MPEDEIYVFLVLQNLVFFRVEFVIKFILRCSWSESCVAEVLLNMIEEWHVSDTFRELLIPRVSHSWSHVEEPHFHQQSFWPPFPITNSVTHFTLLKIDDPQSWKLVDPTTKEICSFCLYHLLFISYIILGISFVNFTNQKRSGLDLSTC